jgi:hypothetical protein
LYDSASVAAKTRHFKEIFDLRKLGERQRVCRRKYPALERIVSFEETRFEDCLLYLGVKHGLAGADIYFLLLLLISLGLVCEFGLV